MLMLKTDNKALHYLPTFLIIAFVIHLTSHTEISHFGHSIVSQQNITGSQVAVKYLFKI